VYHQFIQLHPDKQAAVASFHLHRWLVAAAKYYLNNYNLERMEYKIF
jgi:mannose-6-phosphate isomerase class I